MHSDRIIIEDSFAPINEDDLDRFVKRSGITLPKTYRAFLLHHNGGRPRPHVVTVPVCGDVIVDYLYGVLGPDDP